ncbi:hypothetical protein LARV_03272 [Longilinea arvoryzae]|uniref:Uncharacterized protein n=1 Tax=Longilinea arvoryzae TaxID=360412 RepID=A0A0S7BNA1_9CHLR|nr:hypothetical protein [Longilinea arvoryzae]GAP15483.1 hypothetical protein LARV_03272 [Longilinea arvoryzae]
MAEDKKTHWDDPNLQEAREHFKTAREAFRKSAEAWMPPAFLENRRKMRKEMLLGLRSLIDTAIELTEKHEKTA